MYNEFECSGDPDVTGIKDGSHQAWFTNEFWKANPLLEIFMTGANRGMYISGVVPPIDLALTGLHMSPDAKHTDIIFTGSLYNGYIVSTKFRELLEKFKLPSHVYYPVIFHQKNKKTRRIQQVNGYWWLYFRKDRGETTVNFEECIFDFRYHAKLSGLPEYVVPIHSYVDYLHAFVNNPPSLIPTKLVLNYNFDSELDFWGCMFLSSKNYVSERLILAMEKEKITGYEIRTLEKNRRRSQITGVPFTELIFK